MNEHVWVVVETLKGEITDSAFVTLAAGRVLADAWDRPLTALVAGHDLTALTSSLGSADRVLLLEHPQLAEFSPDPYLSAMLPVLREEQPSAVLLAHTTTGMDLAAALAHALEATSISACRTIEVDGDVRFCSVLCGGKVLAEGPIPSDGAVITVMPGGYKPERGRAEGSPEIESRPVPDLGAARTAWIEYVEPESGDVDITREPVLVSVGRGIQLEDHVGSASSLAEMLGGAVSASRPVVDLGWLSTSRLVGKSGRRVSPRLYLALGISGAPEHLEGVGEPEWIVAINTDENAPIFDVADHGATVDVLELLPVLREKLAEALQLT